MIHPEAAAELLADEVEQHVLRLRELLVRWDENMKAWDVLNAVPYWAFDRPAIATARAEQFEMVKHALDEQAYADYYGENPHEQPFEEQTGLTVADARQLPRVDWLCGHLDEHATKYLIDLSANDGWMLQFLIEACHIVDGHGFDLNHGAVERAKTERGVRAVCADFRTTATRQVRFKQMKAEAVVLFETLEHLPDPIAGIELAAKYVTGTGGHLYVTTPLGAVEGGNLPTWAHVERKGHLWSFRPEDLQALGATVGEVEGIWALPDRTMAMKVSIAR